MLWHWLMAGFLGVSAASLRAQPYPEANIFDLENTLIRDLDLIKGQLGRDKILELTAQHRIFFAGGKSWVLVDGAQEIIERQHRAGVLLILVSDNASLQDVHKHMTFADGSSMAPAFTNPVTGQPRFRARDPNSPFLPSELKDVVAADHVFIFDDNALNRSPGNDANFILSARAEMFDDLFGIENPLHEGHLLRAYGMRSRALERARLSGRSVPDELWRVQWGASVPKTQLRRSPRIDFIDAASRAGRASNETLLNAAKRALEDRARTCGFEKLVGRRNARAPRI